MFFNKERKVGGRGFTLIELLVVIAIIGILSSVVLASLNSARQKSREAKRVADLKQLQIALELYFDTHNTYPITNQWRSGTSVCNATYGSGNPGYGASGYIPGLVPNFISVLPENPNVSSGRCYLYRGNATNYKLLAWGAMELYSSTHPMVDPGYSNCTIPRPNTYAVYSSGGRCW